MNLDLIPLKFHAYAGVRHHSFRVVVAGRPCRFLLDRRRQARIRIPLSIPVLVTTDAGPETVLVGAQQAPELYEALCSLVSVSGETSRSERYLAVYRAYEAVVISRDLDARALRHAIAHARSKLSDPAVVRSLRCRFGSVEIDLRRYDHQKEMYQSIGKMLIELDAAFLRELLRRWREWGRLEHKRRRPQRKAHSLPLFPE